MTATVLVLGACAGAEVDEPSARDELAEAAADTAEEPEDDRDERADDGGLDEGDEHDADGAAGEVEPDPGEGSDDASAAVVCTADDTRLEPTVPDAADRVEQATGDLTGDGRDDTVTTYAIGEDDDAVFLLRVETTTGYVVEASLDEASAMAPVGPLGVAEIGHRQGVAIIAETTGASGNGIGLWGLHDHGDGACALLPVTIPDHTVDRTFVVGGSTGHASGLRCEDVSGDGALELVRIEAERRDEGYHWLESAWRWPGTGAMEHVEVAEGSVGGLEELDGRLGLDCPGVDAP